MLSRKDYTQILARTYVLTEATLIAHWLAQDRVLSALRVQVLGFLPVCSESSFVTLAIHKVGRILLPCSNYVKLNRSLRNGKCKGKNDILIIINIPKFYILSKISWTVFITHDFP